MKQIILIGFILSSIIASATDVSGLYKSAQGLDFVMVYPDSTALFKKEGTYPINAKWSVSNDTLIFTSNRFFYYRSYALFYDTLITSYTYSTKYPEYIYRKRNYLEENGKETYLISTDGKSLKMCGNYYTPYYEKIEAMDSFFLNFDSRPKFKHKIPDIDTIHNTYTARLLNNADAMLQMKLPRGANSSKLTVDIPNVDSVEIKLINYGKCFDYYFGINRKSFDKTFEWMSRDSVAKEINQCIDVIITDKREIKTFMDLVNHLIPFPPEGITLNPYEVWALDEEFENTHGIIFDRLLTKDPLEVRAKIVLYTHLGAITCFASNESIDIFDYRYCCSSLSIGGLGDYLSKLTE